MRKKSERKSSKIIAIISNNSIDFIIKNSLSNGKNHVRLSYAEVPIIASHFHSNTKSRIMRSHVRSGTNELSTSFSAHEREKNITSFDANCEWSTLLRCLVQRNFAIHLRTSIKEILHSFLSLSLYFFNRFFLHLSKQSFRSFLHSFCLLYSSRWLFPRPTLFFSFSLIVSLDDFYFTNNVSHTHARNTSS